MPFREERTLLRSRGWGRVTNIMYAPILPRRCQGAAGVWNASGPHQPLPGKPRGVVKFYGAKVTLRAQKVPAGVTTAPYAVFALRFSHEYIHITVSVVNSLRGICLLTPHRGMWMLHTPLRQAPSSLIYSTTVSLTCYFAEAAPFLLVSSFFNFPY